MMSACRFPCVSTQHFSIGFGKLKLPTATTFAGGRSRSQVASPSTNAKVAIAAQSLLEALGDCLCSAISQVTPVSIAAIASKSLPKSVWHGEKGHKPKRDVFV
jgi:hypothetical protein